MKSNLVLLALILASCQPEMPVTSSILVKGDGLTVPVNKELYGLTIEESTMRWMAVFMRNLYKTGALKMEFLP